MLHTRSLYMFTPKTSQNEGLAIKTRISLKLAHNPNQSGYGWNLVTWNQKISWTYCDQPTGHPNGMSTIPILSWSPIPGTQGLGPPSSSPTGVGVSASATSSSRAVPAMAMWASSRMKGVHCFYAVPFMLCLLKCHWTHAKSCGVCPKLFVKIVVGVWLTWKTLHQSFSKTNYILDIVVWRSWIHVWLQRLYPPCTVWRRLEMPWFNDTQRNKHLVFSPAQPNYIICLVGHINLSPESKLSS